MRKKVRPVFIAPVTATGKIPDLVDIVAISFRNAGDSTVNLDGGKWTLDSKETLSLNVTEDYGSMDIIGINVTFTGGSTNLLQIVILKESPC